MAKALPRGVREKNGSYEARAVVNGIRINLYGTDLNELMEEFEKAKENDLELSDYNFELDSAEIGREEDIPDLQELINKASEVIKRYGEEEHDSFFSVPTYPTITTESWNGDEFIKQRNIVEDFYWDSEKGLMMDVGEGFEVELDELPEIEQLEVCELIIREASNNGITL